ncbi:MAG TPA: alanine--tRNA ligase [Dehalococcoidia bacterium]|nr:alanine--tRNA ligase [Dehalococcoidia bacterium]
MTSDEVRKAYLDFFAEKGHDIVPSSSLIPHGDPTLLFTSAGMVQFKDYYLGIAVPPNPRLASCQKCFRTTDIESVGDASHLTFFEMLGNFSIGDYFKKEAISWAWEFVTQRLKLEPERLWATIYLDDDESFQYWLETGVPEERILRFGEEDNFWGPAGDSGPCGPCSEIHYDFGEEVGCGKPTCRPNCGCARFSEIWNLVFTQYDQDKEGKRTPLPKPNIDTGMGLERTVAAVTGKTSVYDTELFIPLLDCVAKLAGKKYGADNEADVAMRVVAEHGRGITFLIGDGVIPSNEGRGYVLRRLLRRAALFGRRLGLDKPFLAEMAKTTIEHMGHVYPEIVQRRDFITKLIELEEARFSGTLSAGLELLDDILAELASRGEKEISGKQAFKLYDTYGFPVELTKEIARGRGFSVDLAGFEEEMEKQRERARKAELFAMDKKAALELTSLKRSYESTPFVGYQELKHRSVIIDLLVDGGAVETVSQGQSASLILETTPFYGEMGGQVGDTGQIRGASGKFLVTNTIRIPPDIIVHQGKVAEGSLAVGDEVEAEVDGARRLDIARNHTATHLLQHALRQVLGEHVQQRGSLVAPDAFRFDFSHLTAMLKEEIAEVQRIVNERIRQNLPVYDEELPYKKALEEGAIALFDEKYGDVVRVLKIGRPPISIELCGGTHVGSTGEIGFFQIVGESSIGAGLRRIEAVTGRGAEEFVGRRFASLENIAHSLHALPDEAEAKLASVVSELDTERRQRLALERELAKLRMQSLLGQAEEINGIKVLIAKVPSSRLEILREMADFIRDKLGSVVVVLGTVWEGRPLFLAAVTPDLVERGYNAGEIVRQVAKVAGGGGGGKPNLAQAGGKDKNKLDEALHLARSLI